MAQLETPPGARPLPASLARHAGTHTAVRTAPLRSSYSTALWWHPLYWPRAACTDLKDNTQAPATGNLLSLQCGLKLHFSQSEISPHTHGSSVEAPTSAAQAPLLEIHELPNYEIGVTFKYTEEVKESLKETFAASDGRAWDPDLKMWRFPVELQEEVKDWALSLFDESEIRFPGQASFDYCSSFALEVLMCLCGCLATCYGMN